MTASPRLIAIGDIHGCRLALEALIEAIAPGPEDTIVTLGDYIDRGSDSRGVIETLIGLAGRCRLAPLLGNHEEMLLATLDGKAPRHWWLGHGGRDTLTSYELDEDQLDRFPAAHRSWLEACVPYWEAEDFFFTHANYIADEPLERQPAEALRWQGLLEHFPERHQSGRTAILGHTNQRNGEVLDAGHLVCLDTNCHGGGWLTALDTTSGRVWQASQDGELR